MQKIYYYIPLCSKDFAFENILASESISPIAFYKERGFGIDYFYKIPKFNLERALILFDKPPKFDAGASSDVIKFILAVNKEAIDPNSTIVLDDGILAYPKTIYLNKHNFLFHFFSEKEMKIVCLKSETSLPTKGLKKFDNNFNILSEKDCQEFNTSKIQILDVENDNLQNEIFIDRRFNYFKGFIYGFSTGLISSKSPEEIKIRKGLQDILNRFAELKNRYENNISQTKNKNSKVFYNSKLILSPYLDKLRESITAAEKSLMGIIPNSNFSEQKVIEFIKQKIGNRLQSLESIQYYLDFIIIEDELSGTNKYQQIRKYYHKISGDVDPLYYFESLRRQAELYISPLSISVKDNSNDVFKDVLFTLMKYVEQTFSEKNHDITVPLNHIHYSFQSNKINIDIDFQLLQKTEAPNFVIITNIILQNSKIGKGETTKKQILNIVDLVGNSFSKSKTGKETQLYKYLNSEINEYSLESATSVVMKNFVAFIFNPDSLEKLEKYLESKQIDEQWIAYSFWCAFNGFANISRNFVKPIFDMNNIIIQEYIDNYLMSILSIMKAEPQNAHDTSKQTSLNNNISNDNTKKNKEFYDKYILEKYKIKYSEFENLLMNENKEEVIKQFKERFKIAKKEGKKIVDLYSEFMNTSVLF